MISGTMPHFDLGVPARITREHSGHPRLLQSTVNGSGMDSQCSSAMVGVRRKHVHGMNSYFTRLGTIRRLCQGTLRDYIGDYAALLKESGYAQASARAQIHCVNLATSAAGLTAGISNLQR
jgi:hypothetical protein